MATVKDQVLLARYADGDVAAREELTHRYMPMARRLARRYERQPGFDEDLAQVAYMGLLKAIDRFESGAGEFVALAVNNILGELKRHLRDKQWMLRVARPEKERYVMVGEAVEKLTNSLGRSPSINDLAAHTGLSLEHVAEALDVASAYAVSSLEAPRTDTDATFTLSDTLGRPDPGYERVDLNHAAGPIIDRLPEREQRILRLRFVEDLTQAEIAERCGLSQMHISRLLRGALAKLSKVVEEDRVAA